MKVELYPKGNDTFMTLNIQWDDRYRPTSPLSNYGSEGLLRDGITIIQYDKEKQYE